jgi:hypothetical protein
LKISPCIALYLQEKKNLNLEGFGRFYLDSTQVLPDPTEKGGVIVPASYDYTPTVPTDPEFIDFVIKETGKIRPLAIADLETYISLAKQLLNISKPFVIDGVGTLVKTTAGHYEFISGNYEPPKISTDDREKRLRQAKEVNREAVNYENRRAKEKSTAANKGLLKKVLGIFILLLILGGAGWAVYNFILKKDKNAVEQSNKTVTPIQTETVTNATNTDTSKKTDTSKLTALATPVINGQIQYKVVVNVLDRQKAQERFKKLNEWGSKPIMYTKDSTNFKIAFLVRSLPQDSVKIKDSIQRNFITPQDIRAGKTAFIEN